MPRMENVLIAVDGSEASLQGAAKGLELARAFGAQASLLYVVPPVVMPADAPWAPMDDILKAELQRGQQVVTETAAALGAPEARLEVRVGSPAETIVEVAEALAADVIVVGSTGKGAVKRLFVGSVADRLVHISSRPVLVVR